MLTLNRLLLAVSMSCLVATANAAPFDDAVAAHQRGDYAQALKILRPLAAQGNAEAQNNIGVLYYKGLGVTQDYQEALKWYRLCSTGEYKRAKQPRVVLSGGSGSYTGLSRGIEMVQAFCSTGG